jgi:O-antigen biosynthesis protein
MSRRSLTGRIAGLGRGLARAGRIARDEGVDALAQRVARQAYERLGAASLLEALLDEDVADSTRLDLPVPEARPTRGQPLRIGWVTTPPSAGSGGHTTLFRMVEAAERAGHECRLYLYDRYGGDIRDHERVVRAWWPNLRASVHDPREGIADLDAVVATAWDSAHVIATRGSGPMRRLYFIQDYEPFFYGRGAMYALAEDTYRFGFRCIALGAMVAGLLRSEIGLEPDVTQYGCDTSIYHRIDDGRVRRGVVVFARPEVPRRGFWLARLALERFHAAHPDVDIHLYGARVSGLSFPAIQHGKLTPAQLNELYNSCVAGLTLSFTNISLVAEEMLAAGVIPVANDSALARADLANDHVRWALPTPESLAEALGAAVTDPDREAASQAAAESVHSVGWSRAQADVLRIIEDEVYGAPDEPRSPGKGADDGG